MPTNLNWSAGKKSETVLQQKNHIYVPGIGINTHGDMQAFNNIVQNVQTHLKKHNMTYPVYL